jgi:hydrogenase maturation factor
MDDPRVLVGPGIGLDCAVVDAGDKLLVFKSDPITFATEEIGWYLVHVNANDIATAGAQPRWLLLTALLPATSTTSELVESISQQVFAACREISVTVIGGHTEVTHGLDRPILIGTLVGEVDRERLVTPRGARPGDRMLLTKGVPIEAVALLAREFPQRLAGALSGAEMDEARRFLRQPGISVLPDAQTALAAGCVTAMHDPTEGGLAMALWELAEASGRTLVVDPAAVPVPPLAARICSLMALDPLAALSSGALLLTAPSEETQRIRSALERAGIRCAEIGWVEEGRACVYRKTEKGREVWMRPARDEIARAYDGIDKLSPVQPLSGSREVGRQANESNG